MADSNQQNLERVILRLRERILDIRSRKLNIGEQNTKSTLINPLLSVLGWDLENLDEISLEYRRKPQDNPVDYALFLYRTPCLFVEAKSLDADLSDRRWISQMLGYATVVGVEWCVLTNGDEYRLYNAHAPVDVDEKLFREVCLSDASQSQNAIETLMLLSKDKMGEKQLNVLWNAHFVDRQVKAAFESLVQNQDDSLVRLLHRKTPSLSNSEIRASLKRGEFRVDFPVVMSPANNGDMTPARRKTIRQRSTQHFVKRRTPKSSYSVTLKDLIDGGLITPPMQLAITYLDQQLNAVVQPDGTILCNGQTYASLSVAAGMARNVVKGPPSDGRRMYQTNGWTFWKYRDPQTGSFVEVDRLRQEYLKNRPNKQ